MRQLHRAGEKLFIDCCGPTVAVVDRGTREIRSAQIFVCVFGASSYTYAEATWTHAHRHMIDQFDLRNFTHLLELVQKT